MVLDMTGKLTLTTRRISAITMMVEIARQGMNNKPVAIHDLAAQTGIPQAFLQAPAGELRRAGLIGIVVGPGGGYALAKPPDRISILDIALSSKDLPGGGDNKRHDGLVDSGVPRAQDLWDQLDICQYLLLQHITLADILRRDLQAHPLLKGIRDLCGQSGDAATHRTDTETRLNTIAA
jgi:Rrf2 family iron-sulfur cluster assembly transcriptional regulator